VTFELDMIIDNFRNKISPTPSWGSNKQITMYLIVVIVNPSRAWAIFRAVSCNTLNLGLISDYNVKGIG
jgi:hypothetical protein